MRGNALIKLSGRASAKAKQVIEVTRIINKID